MENESIASQSLKGSQIPSYHFLFEKLPGLMIILKPEPSFPVITATDAYLKIAVKSRETLVNRSIFESFPDNNPDETDVNGADSLRTSLLRCLEFKVSDSMPVQKYSYETAPGVFRTAFWSVRNTPVLDSDGTILYIVHEVEDITEYVESINPIQNKSESKFDESEIEVYLRAVEVQKTNQDLLKSEKELVDQLYRRALEVENERENFRKLFRQTPEMVCILYGPEHIFEFVNDAHEVALGFNAVGMKVRVAQPESVEVHGILDDVYRTGITAELREIPVTLGTKLRYFNLTYAPRFDVDGKVNGIMILGSEITAQFEARETMVKAKEYSEAANASKSAFIANMSHEIRTPIGVIRGFCELLQDDDISPAERHEYLSRIIRSTRGLTRIIDDILDLAKVEAGKLEVEEIQFSLNDLIHEVIEMFLDVAREKDIRLQFEPDPGLPESAHSDPTRLRQILVNIVGNAIKFTSKGVVRIRISGKEHKDHGFSYEIRVIDSGIGLSQDQVDRLFQPFVQADGNTNRVYGGTGLGLVISRRFAEALGGSIRIENFQEGSGCTFVISFYDSKHSSAKTPLLEKISITDTLKPTASPSDKILANLHILVADDSTDNQMLVKRILTKNGAIVELANNGEEAIEKGLSQNYDLVLMDLQMPRVDGYEATRSLRSQGFTKPIIALTAHAMIEERIKTKEAGCTAHLTKPINSVELIETIKALSKDLGQFI